MWGSWFSILSLMLCSRKSVEFIKNFSGYFKVYLILFQIEISNCFGRCLIFSSFDCSLYAVYHVNHTYPTASVLLWGCLNSHVNHPWWILSLWVLQPDFPGNPIGLTGGCDALVHIGFCFGQALLVIKPLEAIFMFTSQLEKEGFLILDIVFTWTPDTYLPILRGDLLFPAPRALAIRPVPSVSRDCTGVPGCWLLCGLLGICLAFLQAQLCFQRYSALCGLVVRGFSVMFRESLTGFGSLSDSLPLGGCTLGLPYPQPSAPLWVTPKRKDCIGGG